MYIAREKRINKRAESTGKSLNILVVALRHGEQRGVSGKWAAHRKIGRWCEENLALRGNMVPRGKLDKTHISRFTGPRAKRLGVMGKHTHTGEWRTQPALQAVRPHVCMYV